MSKEAKVDLSSIDRPRVLQEPDGRYFAFFPGGDDGQDQSVLFKSWHALGGTLGREVATAFVHLFANNSRLGKEVTRGNLNKLYHFVKKRGIKSLLDLKDEDVKNFMTFVEPVESTRRKDWDIARRVIEHTFSQARQVPPRMEHFPWTRKPEDWSPSTNTGPTVALEAVIQPEGSLPVDGSAQNTQHARSRLAGMPVAVVENGSAKQISPLNLQPSIINTDGLTVFFPARGTEVAHRQDFTDWGRFNETIASEVAAAAIGLKRHNSVKSIITWRTQIRNLLSFLKSLPAKERPISLTDLTAQQMLEFRTFIDKGDVATRSKIWRASTGVIAYSCESKSKTTPHFPVNPWPGHAARAPFATEPMTAAEVGSVLNACTRAMEATMALSKEPDFEGVTLADLFPFVVVLTFWTLFNPETIATIRISDIRPDLLGRFAIVGQKGRSTVDQVATFPSTDEHHCAPKKVIENLLAITQILRHRLPPDKRILLFVGRVRRSARANAMVQAYSDLNGSMHSNFRDAFCQKYNLPSFTIQQIRATGAVIVNRLFGGDVKTAQLLLNHLQVGTTDNYVKKDARRIENERLADQMEKRVRYVRSGGLSDVRDKVATPQSAATPGFVCADPFAPPSWLDQDEGMCAAYGACPTCPLASVDRQCSVSFAYILRLRNQIREAHQNPRMIPQRWLETWKPRQIAIEEKWLPMFSSVVRAKTAADIRDVNTPPLPYIGEL